MSFSFLVWNVEKFKAKDMNRIRRVVDHIEGQSPDVFCILEFMGKSSSPRPSKIKGAVRRLISKSFPEYDFGLTDSKKRIEILIGWKRNKFSQVFFTQRRELNDKNPNLRPGGLLSIRQVGESYFHNFLFLHTKSGRSKEAFDYRKNMFKKIWKLKKALQGLNIQGGKARFVALGDLNTMGRSKIGSKPSISGRDELKTLEKGAKAHGMRILSKSQDKTWSTISGGTKSNLDHVIVSEELRLQEWVYGDGSGIQFEVEVLGWNERNGNARKSYIKNISDHCSLWAEIV